MAGLVSIRNKQPVFISPTEYIGILSRRPHPSSQIESGQWVCCLAGRYRDDIGYVFETNVPMHQWYAVVAFIPRISHPGGKRQRDGRPTPQAWTADELTLQYGERSVKRFGSGQFNFRGGSYLDGLVLQPIPFSILRVLEHSPTDIMPFVQSARIRTAPAFAATLKRFAQDSVRIGDRIFVTSGEHAGIIGRIGDIQDTVADIETQLPEQHAGLLICIALCNLIPYFLEGDHVKMRWSDRFGMVIAVDHDAQKVTFFDKKTQTEVPPFSLHHLP